MSRPAASGVGFVGRELPAPDAATFVERSISAAPARYEARVTLHGDADEITRRIPAHWGEVTRLDARRCEYRTGDDDIGWLATRVAMLGFEFEVHEPPELGDHLRVLGERLARATGPRGQAPA